jgi:glutamate carboxypeptidase
MVEHAVLKRFLKSRQSEMLELLERLVRLESPSSDKKAVDKCTAYTAGELQKTGAKITYFPQIETGDFCLAKFNYSDQDKVQKPLLLLTHSDTVWDLGMIEQMPFRLTGRRAYGPGVLDMKAGIVMVVFALKALNELDIRPQKNISVFINSSEEIGTADSYRRIAVLAKRSSSVLCLEPSLPGGALKVQRKGRLVVQISTLGKAAHAGHPEKGINAIEEIMCHLWSLSELKNRSISSNIGLIQGGKKPNIVADSASAIIDFRFWKNDHKERILQELKKLKPRIEGAKVKVKVISSAPPMEQTEASKKLLKKVQEAASSIGLNLGAGRTGGGSDASIASQFGVPTIDGLGPDGNGIHTKQESLLIQSLFQRTLLLAELLRTL